MQLTLQATRRTPHGASRFVLAMSAWWVKTRRAPSGHCRDARVYGYTTTAVHDVASERRAWFGLPPQRLPPHTTVVWFCFVVLLALALVALRSSGFKIKYRPDYTRRS